MSESRCLQIDGSKLIQSENLAIFGKDFHMDI